MAVTVVGQSKDVARKVDCAGCGAQLQYYRNDVKTEYCDRMHYVITCVSCKKDVQVKSWF